MDAEVDGEDEEALAGGLDEALGLERAAGAEAEIRFDDSDGLGAQADGHRGGDILVVGEAPEKRDAFHNLLAVPPASVGHLPRTIDAFPHRLRGVGELVQTPQDTPHHHDAFRRIHG